jgi:hypothetical protein
VGKIRIQCKACPWRKDVVPECDIPGGYCEEKHRNLKSTIAEPGVLNIGSTLRLMACPSPGREIVCVGWLAHQLGPGNNIALRMAASDGRFPRFELVGDQHECLEDTLPKRSRR